MGRFLSGWNAGLVGLGIVSGVSALASSFVHKTFPEAVEDAPIIVRGQASEPSTRWVNDASGARKIYTYWNFQVEEVLKGDIPHRSIQVRQIGGEKDGVGLHVPGGAQLRVSEDSVIFLSSATPEGSYEVRSWSLGQYQIQKGDGGVEVLTGGRITGDLHGESQNGQGQSEPKTWTVTALRELIRTQSQGGNAAQTQDLASSSPAAKNTAPALQPSSPVSEHTETHSPNVVQTDGATNRQNTHFGVILSGLFLLAGIVIYWVLRR